MKILAVGDSFTAGAELTDETEVSNWPGYYSQPPRTESEQAQIDLWMNKFRYPWMYKNFATKLLHEKMSAKEKAKTYVNLVAQELNIEVNNIAVSGTSMYTLTRLLTEQKVFSNNLANTIVFYQPTSIDRFCQYKDLEWKDYIFASIENYARNESKDFVDYIKYKISLENNYSLCMAWFKEFYSCIALLESSDCVKWYLIDTGFIALMDQALRYHYNKDQVSELMRYRIHLELTLKDKWLNLGASARALAALGENETHCPGGHYSPKVHEHFKEIVVNRLKTDNLI